MDEKTKKLVVGLLKDIIATSEDENGDLPTIALKVIDWSEDAVKILEQIERDA